ncbi:Six-hairpin glycosidase-like protein, partial [Cunninghamella echinulata]
MSSNSYNLSYDNEEDKSFGFHLEMELNNSHTPTPELPEGKKYVADTRRRGSLYKNEEPASTDDGSVLEDTSNNVRTRGYLPIENYGIIGNLRTVAICGTDGSIDFFCYPKFDSPSIFCRVSEILDYMHIPDPSQRQATKPLLPWIIRSVKVIRGTVTFKLKCYPSFNYGLTPHTTSHHPTSCSKIDPSQQLEQRIKTSIYDDDKTTFLSSPEIVTFQAEAEPKENKINGIHHFGGLKMDLRYLSKCGDVECPYIKLTVDDKVQELVLKGPGVTSEFTLQEGQETIFIFREVPPSPDTCDQNDVMERRKRMAFDPPLTVSLLNALFRQTAVYWQNWVNQCRYKGGWREHVIRSALTLKLLQYEPTGAIVAAPTFGVPEAIGGPRNWDYRYVWIRDASFTIYALLRLGFTEEASKYMQYIEKRCQDLNEDGSLNIMYSIDGVKRLEEAELNHFEGYRQSSPVRIGNGAYDHLQLDIYGELMDGIYLYNKYGAPVSYDVWCAVQKLANYVVKHWELPDMSIWEVRSSKQRFTYSMVMCWVALDRAIEDKKKYHYKNIFTLRLASKRMFPCPDHDLWLKTRDQIYVTIQEKCYNKEFQMYSQSIETPDAVDASCLIMPLVFFSSPIDPRLLSTIQRILLPPEK